MRLYDLSFGVYPNPLVLKIASGEREPFTGEGKRFEMKSAEGNLWYPILLNRGTPNHDAIQIARGQRRLDFF